MESKSTVLIVDDSDAVRITTREILEKEGFAVLTANDGREALSLLQQIKPDLFLIDVFMPEMGGLDLLKNLNVFENTYEAIMMTGHENFEDATTAMQFDAFSYIRKPFEGAKLLDQVKKALAMVAAKKKRFEKLDALEINLKTRTRELGDLVRELVRQDMRIDAIVNSMGEGLLAIDNSGAVVLMNTVAEAILGTTFGECAGAQLSRVKTKKEMKEFLMTCLEEKGRPGRSTVVTFIGGRPRCISANLRPITNETGGRTGTVVLLVDRTDAEQVETLRNSFLSIAAHELRTPINIIMNYLSLVKVKGGNPEFRSIAVDDMRTANYRMKYLVNNIIDFISLSARDIPLCNSPVDIGVIAEEEIKKAFREMPDRKASYEIMKPDTDGNYSTDPRLLRIVLSAVINNAVKFNIAGGHIRISILDAPAGNAPGVSIEVEDDGCGISPRARTNLFECFIQGEEPDTRRHSGLGTGLYLAKRAVDFLGGTIAAGPATGRGTRFVIELPCVKSNDGFCASFETGKTPSNAGEVWR